MTSTLRLLLLTDEMEVGGTQRQIVALARGLDPARFSVTVAYFRNPSFLAHELAEAGIRVVRIAKAGRLDVSFLCALRRFLATERFDVMHCFSFSAELWGALARALVSQTARPALITSVRGKYEWYSAGHWLVKRAVSRASAAIVGNSHAGALYACQRMRVPAGAVMVIHNGVPARRAPSPDRARALRQQLGIVTDGFVALFVGRLVEHKDLPTLLRAVRRLRERQPDFSLLVAGDGPLRGTLQRETDRLGLAQSVKFLGERADVDQLMAASDVLVLPSVREGLSNVVLEAMSVGLTVVASDAGGNRELIEDGVDGRLFATGSDQQLALLLEELALDPALRARLARAARFKVATRFSIAAMIERTGAVYEQACGVRLTPAEGAPA